MSTLALALRNLLRNRRRSVMTLLAMMIGLVAVLLFGGYIRDITYALQSDFVRMSGHLQIQREGYFRYGSGNPAAYGIRDYHRLLAKLKSDPVLAPMLVVATPTLQFGGIAGNFAAGVSRTIYASGAVVEDQNLMRQWNDYGLRVLSKPLTLAGTPPDSAVIGVGVARVLQLCGALDVPDCESVPANAGAAASAPGAGAGQGAQGAGVSNKAQETGASSNAQGTGPSKSSQRASAAPKTQGAGTSRRTKGTTTSKSAPDSALPDDIAALAADQAPPPAQGAGAPTRIEILATNAHGAPNVAAVNVLRAERQGIKEFDDVYVALHLSQAQKLIFGADPPQVTAIALQLHHTSQIPAARARIEQLLASQPHAERLEVLDYKTLNPYYEQTLAMFDVMFGFISVLIGGIVLFTVGNTMSMAVVERTAEIGTLRSIGVRRSGIRALFVTEGLLLGVLGAVLGTVVAIAASWAVNAIGLTWTPPGRIDAVPLAVRVAGEHRMIVTCAIGLVIVAALSAILPAARAARMNIVDALRHV